MNDFTVEVSQVMRNTGLKITIAGALHQSIRTWVAVRLMQLAGWVLRVGEIEVQLVAKDEVA